MKITKQQLKQIIKEELEAVMNETAHIPEGHKPLRGYGQIHYPPGYPGKDAPPPEEEEEEEGEYGHHEEKPRSKYPKGTAHGGEIGRERLEEIIKEELEAVINEKDLSAKERRDLPDSDFALAGKGEGPEGKQAGSYPIPDEDHARMALAMVKKHGTPEEQARVRAAVKRKFPGIKQGKE